MIGGRVFRDCGMEEKEGENDVILFQLKHIFKKFCIYYKHVCASKLKRFSMAFLNILGF